MITRRHLLLGGGAGLLALSGCGPQQAVDLVLGVEPPTTAVNPAATLDLPAHVLRRLTFGEHPDDRAALLALGKTPESAVEAWVVRQLHPETIDDSVCERLIRRREALAEPLGELYEFKERVLLHELTAATLLRAVYSKRQLHEQLCHFWNDHFNVDMSKGECAWVTVAYDREVIRPHALGRFSDLLRAVVLSPAMLWYLDGRVNRVEGKGAKPNENYARELLELHTLGVDGGYTQQDVMEVARCLSGWTVRDRHQWRKGLVEFHRDAHDDGAKIVLGETLPAGGGERDLDHVLRLVTAHPATARQVARKLCTRFIADDPPAAAVDHVAQAFTVSRGDLALTMRALIDSDAFRAPAGFATKLKRPFHYVASCLRATAAHSDAGDALIDYLGRLGHLPFQFPTPDGQPEHAEAWTGTLLWRWRFAGAFARGALPGTRADTAALVQRCGSPGAVATHLFARQADARENAALAVAGDNALALALASPAFQRC
ncbi:MAG: DUF1800 domain-containing protein [Planctomycetes bacterium]|nr:DUF1800 domain-containing protein [Planctomycetota bacterium]